MSTNQGRASREALEDLHGAIATALADKIRTGDATAADLAVARQFLKDNGIDSIAASNNPLGNLVKSLPFAPEGE
jgi:hypothetical protein